MDLGDFIKYSKKYDLTTLQRIQLLLDMCAKIGITITIKFEKFLPSGCNCWEIYKSTPNDANTQLFVIAGTTWSTDDFEQKSTGCIKQCKNLLSREPSVNLHFLFIGVWNTFILENFTEKVVLEVEYEKASFIYRKEKNQMTSLFEILWSYLPSLSSFW